MSQMLQCQHCGTFVPAEKAFCPNCSEPMEMEEKSNRNNSFSSDMMSTIRDDPEKFRELLKLKASVKKQPQASPPPAPPAPTAQVSPPPPPVMNAGQPVAPPVAAAYNQRPAAPPLPAPSDSGKRNLILGIGAVALLAIVIVLLFVFKVI